MSWRRELCLDRFPVCPVERTAVSLWPCLGITEPKFLVDEAAIPAPSAHHVIPREWLRYGPAWLVSTSTAALTQVAQLSKLEQAPKQLKSKTVLASPECCSELGKHGRHPSSLQVTSVVQACRSVLPSKSSPHDYTQAEPPSRWGHQAIRGRRSNPGRAGVVALAFVRHSVPWRPNEAPFCSRSEVRPPIRGSSC